MSSFQFAVDQHTFWQLLTKHPLLCSADVQRSDAHGEPLQNRFRGEDSAQIARRVSIYSHGYVMRIVAVLEQEFEVMARLMGEDEFRECVWRYLRHHPSRDPNLRWVGRDFVSYLASANAAQYHRALRQPWLLDVAELEWARSLAFDAVARDPIAFAQLMQTPPDEWASLALEWVGSLQCVESDYDIESIWHQVASGRSLSSEPRPAGSKAVLVWRKASDVLCMSVERVEARALALLERKVTLAQFCERLCELHEKNEQQIARHALGYLEAWTGRGWLTSGSADQTGEVFR